MAKHGLVNLPGLTVGVGKGEIIQIGDDVKVIIQRNNSGGCARYAVRVVAPKDKLITILNSDGTKRGDNERG